MIKGILGQILPDRYKNYKGCSNCIYQLEPFTACEKLLLHNTITFYCKYWKERKETE